MRIVSTSLSIVGPSRPGRERDPENTRRYQLTGFRAGERCVVAGKSLTGAPVAAGSWLGAAGAPIRAWSPSRSSSSRPPRAAARG